MIDGFLKLEKLEGFENTGWYSYYNIRMEPFLNDDE